MSNRRQLFHVAACVLFLVEAAGAAWAAAPVATDPLGRPLYQSGVITVKLAPSVVAKRAPVRDGEFGIPTVDAIALEVGVRDVEPHFQTASASKRTGLGDLSRAFRVTVSKETDVRRAVALFSSDPNVEYAEQIPLYYLAEIPDDPDYDRQRFLRVIMAEEAWDIHKGQDGAVEVVVGVVDSGVTWDHPDLAENMLQNLGEDLDGDGRVLEKSGDEWVFDPDDINGLDDDGNGYPDDFVGWNFLNEDGTQDNDPADPNGHGTHVAGLAAARTDNGVGIAAISWNVRLLAVSASNEESGTAIPWALPGVVYLADRGVDVINMSWGGYATSQLERDVYDYARDHGCLLVAAAGNESTSDLHYPSAHPGVVSVASVGSYGSKIDYSNYGISVDVSALGGSPGNEIYSTVPSGYGIQTGTSMASPIAAGLMALVKSFHPEWSSEQIVAQVLATADSIDDVNSRYTGQLGSGRLNAYRALTEVPDLTTPELRLGVTEVGIDDDTGDGSIEPGESAELLLEIRNYSHLGGSESLTLSLSSTDPLIQILEPDQFVSIPMDGEVWIPAGFRFRVSSDAPTGVYDLTVTASAGDAVVSDASNLDVRIVVASGGVLVWEGSQENTYSGRWLRDELTALGYEVLYLSGDFPPGFVGFDAVFLSFGNAGLATAARLDSRVKVEAIRDYLKSGGRVFLDGGDTLGYDVFDLVDGEDLLPLFGLDGGSDGDTNSIDRLEGQEDALTAGMLFSETSQDPVEWIDKYEPSADGVVAFEESNYGVVAVQYVGRYRQRTFCFAYTLSELTDGDFTRTQLLERIVEFFSASSPPVSTRQPRRSAGRVGSRG